MYRTERPIQAEVGQLVRAVNLDGGIRMGMLCRDFRDGGYVAIIAMWDYEPMPCYYVIEIVDERTVPQKVKDWLDAQRVEWREYWEIMEMLPDTCGRM